MPTTQIAEDQWENYLTAFSAHNQTRKVNVEIESSELGPQRVADAKQLLGIEPDLKDKREISIYVVTGDAQGDEPSALSHRVMNPKAVWVKEDEEGLAQALDIESEEGRTLIEFTE